MGMFRGSRFTGAAVNAGHSEAVAWRAQGEARAKSLWGRGGSCPRLVFGIGHVPGIAFTGAAVNAGRSEAVAWRAQGEARTKSLWGRGGSGPRVVFGIGHAPGTAFYRGCCKCWLQCAGVGCCPTRAFSFEVALSWRDGGRGVATAKRPGPWLIFFFHRVGSHEQAECRCCGPTREWRQRMPS